jgi:DNA modification methylase
MKIRDRIRELRRVPARDLVPNPRNWRRHPSVQQDALKGLLTELGYCDATIARQLPDGRLQLIDGHLRCETTPDFAVPVLVLDVSEEEADKLLLSLDPLASLAHADGTALTSLLASVDTESEAVQSMFRDLAAGDLTPIVDPEPLVGLTDPDDIPEPPPEAKTRPGDLWLLGEHRLLCADSSKPEDVDRLLNGAAIHLANCDPPYGVNVEPRSQNAIDAGLSSFEGSKHKKRVASTRELEKATPNNRSLRPRDRPLANDFLTKEEFVRRLHAWFGNVGRVLLPGRSFYIWGGYSNLPNYPPVLAANDLFFSQAIIWSKLHPVLTRKDFLSCFELAFYGWRLGAGHQVYGPSNALDIWEIKKVSPQAMVHLTEKPVELAIRAIQYSSRLGENVLDLFGGSGSTLIAAEQTRRHAFLMELDALYCDVIVERWERFTGKQATRTED